MNPQTKALPLNDYGTVAVFTKSQLLKIVEPSLNDEDGYTPPQSITLSKYSAIELRDFLNSLNLE